MKLKSKVILCFIMIVFCCISLNVYIGIKYKSLEVTIVVSLFSIIVMILSGMLMYFLKRYIYDILNKLSKLIYSIVDIKQEEVFSILNDDMPSKLQSQVIKLTNILRAENRRVENERDEIKSIISDISHQLKTPLSNLKLYHEILQDTSISKDEYREFNDDMKTQIEKLSFLIENMIKMSRLESGAIKLNVNENSLNEICLSAIKQIYKKAKYKNIEIEFNSKEDIILKVDKKWTIEAIFNIIDNAIKYTNFGGKIVINVIRYEMFVRIDISDNGIGIDATQINNIFKRFYRGSNVENKEGIGLGLYLSRKIIQEQSGYIKVKSRQNEGSTFSVFIYVR